MSWSNGNGGGYAGRAPKMPDLGRGRLRRKEKKSEKSPDFSGLINFNGQIISCSIWYEPPRVLENGQQLGESFSVMVSPYQPTVPAQAPQVGYAHQPQYAPQPQMPVHAQPGPGPQYQPGPHAPQHGGGHGGGYAPAPGYVPPPPPQAAPPAPQPAWGGQPGRPPQQAAAPAQPVAGGFTLQEAPF